MNLAVIQARLNSTRLPGKALMELRGKAILHHVVDRAWQAARVDQVVVATCGNGGEESIVGHCEEWDVPCLCDSHWRESDVLCRYAYAATLYQPTWMVRICGDNPLIDPSAIDLLIERADAARGKIDYVGFRYFDGTPAITHPTGYFAEVVSAASILRLHGELPADAPQREHVTQAMYQSPHRYQCLWCPLPLWYGEDTPSMAIDIQEDLDRVAEAMS